MVQVQTFAWPRSPASADLEPTRDLLAVPPVFELAGNAKQIIRVALRGAARRRARACLPAADHRGAARRRCRHRRAVRPAAEPAGVRHPAGRRAQAGLVGPPDEPVPAELVLRNEGTAHLQVRRIMLRPAGRERRRRARSTPRPTCSPARSMAGRCRASPGATALQLEAETSIGPISASVARRAVSVQRERPGELVHIDIKKLGRIDGVGHRITGDRRGQERAAVGWELPACRRRRRLPARLHRDPARRAQGSAVAFLERALAWFAGHGVSVERVMTDNGSAYRSQRFRQALAARRPQAQAHPALHAAHQRQGRALHPDQPARMGLPARLRELGRANRSHAPLAPRLQSPPTPLSPS